MLNHMLGEPIGKLGIGQVVPVSKWADTTLFDFACERAEQSFVRAGAILPIEFEEQEILVQEYPAAQPPAIAFLFTKKIAGKQKYHPCVINLTPEIVSELVTAGRWQRPN